MVYEWPLSYLKFVLQQTPPPPRTGGATSLTGLALGFWAPAYRKFSATTGAGLAPPSDSALSAPLVKLNMRYYESVSHNKSYIEKFSLGEALLPKTGLVPVLLTVNSRTHRLAPLSPIGNFAMRNSICASPVLEVASLLPIGKFEIRKLSIEGSGATSKTGLAHREFPYMDILL